MIVGKEEGKFHPCNLCLMSFMAMENSSLSIFPSLSKSDKFLQERWEESSAHNDLRTQNCTFLVSFFLHRDNRKCKHTQVLMTAHPHFLPPPLQPTFIRCGRLCRKRELNRKLKTGSRSKLTDLKQSSALVVTHFCNFKRNFNNDSLNLYLPNLSQDRSRQA